MKLSVLVPGVVLVALVGLLAFGLGNDPRAIPSPFIGKPAPDFSLPTLNDRSRQLTQTHLKGQVSLVNVWASWCVACRHEHQLLVDLSRQNVVNIIGLNYKDDSANAKLWLQRLGNPYSVTLVDREGRAGIDWGVYGVPETFVVDRDGMVRYKHIGPLTPDALRNTVLPLIAELSSGA